MAQGVEIRAFDPQAASDAEMAALNRFVNQIRSEAWPEDPPVPLEETILDERVHPPQQLTQEWLGWNSGEVVARAALGFRRQPPNVHEGRLQLEVRPDWRRRGLARQLLARAVEVGETEGKRLLRAHTLSRVPAGDAFMNRLGAHMARENYASQLDLDEVNRAVVERWLGRGDVLATDFELGCFERPYPRAELEALMDLGAVMNTQPRGDLELDDWRPNLEEELAWEAAGMQRGWRQWTMWARDRAGGQYVGYTAIGWRDFRPELLQQGDTAVRPEYRQRGIGSWLKAAMLDRVMRERPQARMVHTRSLERDSCSASTRSFRNRMERSVRMSAGAGSARAFCSHWPSRCR